MVVHAFSHSHFILARVVSYSSMATHVQDVCEDCSSTTVFITQIVLSVFGVFVTFLVLFLTGWRHVFLEKDRWVKANSQGKRENFVHYYYDKVMEKFIGFCVRCWRAIDRMFQNGNGVYESSLKRGDHVKIRATGELGVVSGFKVTHSWQFICVKLNNSGVKKDYVRNNLEKISNLSLQNHQWKLIIQLGKIFFANFQVISTFIKFKVTLPPVLEASIRRLSNAAKILIFDITVFPAVGCLTGHLGFFERTLLRTMLPLLITLFMLVPVPVVMWQIRQMKLASTPAEASADEGGGRREGMEEEAGEEEERLAPEILEAERNLEKTKHACHSNILGWLFLAFPSATLASMQAFSCREIQEKHYLVADLKETCPRDRSDGTLGYSIFSTSIWALGTLLVFYGSMKCYKVPEMATLKRNHAIINAMIGAYLKNADSRRQSDSSQQVQFTGMENPAKLTLGQLFALLTFKWERRRKEMAEEDEVDVHLEDDLLPNAQDQAKERVEDALEDAVLRNNGSDEETASRSDGQSASGIDEQTTSGNSSPGLTNLADANTRSSEEESVLRQVQRLCEALDLEIEISYQLIEDPDKSRIIDWPNLFDDLTSALKSKRSTSDLAVWVFGLWRVTQLELRTCTDVLVPNVVKLGSELTEEGIIALPPLKWNAALDEEELQSLGFPRGASEFRMLQSLGFLLDAYQVDSWSWELVEIVRKLILTSILMVWFDGSKEHLAGSLLTTFVFILLHLKRRPYLNTGLNNFQTYALITQFLTILTCILFLLVDCLNQLHEAQPDSVAKFAAEFWSWVIVVINWFVAIFYPAYSLYVLLTDSKIKVTAYFWGLAILFLDRMKAIISYLANSFCALLPARGLGGTWNGTEREQGLFVAV